MIKEKCFSKEWIDNFRSQKEFRQINPPVLEKMIHALSLLEQLKFHGLQFIFKGGTSLVLLLQKARRFSVDIDITTKVTRTQIEHVLDTIIKNSHFSSWELDEERSYKTGVPKAHYEVTYTSELNPVANYVLLDILFEENCYPETCEMPIRSEWLESKNDILVEMPTIESILGDKLTAFAPNTVGILYGKNKEKEIIKQLFDIGCLFDEANEMKTIRNSFDKIGSKEIAYRKLDISLDHILDDIINTALLIAKRTKNNTEPNKSNFKSLEDGIKRFSSFLITEKFNIEHAITAAGKAAYLAKKLKEKDFSPLVKYSNQNISKTVVEGEFAYLNKIKKHRDKAAFFYWHMFILS